MNKPIFPNLFLNEQKQLFQKTMFCIYDGVLHSY